MKKHEKIYIKHIVCLLPLFSFDDISISGDYDTDLNENKTVCEHPKRKIPAGTGEKQHFYGKKEKITGEMEQICKA